MSISRVEAKTIVSMLNEDKPWTRGRLGIIKFFDDLGIKITSEDKIEGCPIFRAAGHSFVFEVTDYRGGGITLFEQRLGAVRITGASLL